MHGRNMRWQPLCLSFVFLQPARLIARVKSCCKGFPFPTRRPTKLFNYPGKSNPKQCCGVFLLEIVSGSLHQNAVVPLLQDVFVRISASAASRPTCGSLVQDLSCRISAPRSCSRTTCARSLCVGLLCEMSVSGGLYQEPLGPLVQGPCRNTCAKSVYEDFLCKVFVSKPAWICLDLVGVLVQDRCVWIFCPRSLCPDLCSKIL